MILDIVIHIRSLFLVVGGAVADVAVAVAFCVVVFFFSFVFVVVVVVVVVVAATVQTAANSVELSNWLWALTSFLEAPHQASLQP